MDLSQRSLSEATTAFPRPTLHRRSRSFASWSIELPRDNLECTRICTDTGDKIDPGQQCVLAGCIFGQSHHARDWTMSNGRNRETNGHGQGCCRPFPRHGSQFAQFAFRDTSHPENNREVVAPPRNTRRERQAEKAEERRRPAKNVLDATLESPSRFHAAGLLEFSGISGCLAPRGDCNQAAPVAVFYGGWKRGWKLFSAVSGFGYTCVFFYPVPFT